MLDRTTFDLRIAEHHTTTAQINRQGWQQHGHTDHCHGHAASASVLVALAARLVAFGRTGGGRGVSAPPDRADAQHGARATRLRY